MARIIVIADFLCINYSAISNLIVEGFIRYLAGMRRVPCLGHMLHNAVTKGLEGEEIATLLSHCRKIVSLFHSSQPYRTKLKKVMKDLKLPDKQLVNDVVTR